MGRSNPSILLHVTTASDGFDTFLERLRAGLPEISSKLGDGSAYCLESIGPPASDLELEELERSLGVGLPDSYKRLLRCARGFSLFGGNFRVEGFPFFHESPPSEGMLCIADYFLEADGDQVLFDVTPGLVDGEYPLVYYAHDEPSVRPLARSLPELLSSLLDRPAA